MIYCFREYFPSVSSQHKICHLILFLHFTFIKLYQFISHNFLNSNLQNNTRSSDRTTESTKSNQNLSAFYLYYWHLVWKNHKSVSSSLKKLHQSAVYSLWQTPYTKLKLLYLQAKTDGVAKWKDMFPRLHTDMLASLHVCCLLTCQLLIPSSIKILRFLDW